MCGLDTFFLDIFAIYGVAVKHAFNSICELYLLQLYCLVYNAVLK